MPPAVVILALVAVGVPAAARAAFGSPRALPAAWLAAAAAAAVAQAVGELSGSRLGTLGDAHLALAVAGAGLASLIVAAFERRR